MNRSIKPSTRSGSLVIAPSDTLKLCALLALITLSLLAVACGGETRSTTAPAKFAPGSVTEDDLYKTLKFDSRVQDYEADGDVLKVSVNAEWIASPPGIQERSVSQWFGMWQAAHGGSANKPQEGLKVVIQYEGNEVAKWTAEGYDPMRKEEPEKGESSSES